ncbi:MAG: TraR/DksA C4-type zinc finger protein, partial [Anaerolineae bacterium]|nr:TraR/DksA C4-type zinc finger protein [Anaerolineae bacterium]
MLPLHPREPIEELIRQGNVDALLRKAGELHGHYCPYLSLGVRASYIALRELGLPRSTGMERILAIVETNSCFSDGVQFVTGCSFGNNGLIYHDVGKTAVTVTRRDGNGIRVIVRPEWQDGFSDRYPEANELFQKIVVRHEEATPDEQERLARLWADVSQAILSEPEESVFQVSPRRVDLPPLSRIYASVRCAICGENVMETRARLKDGQPVCLDCIAAEHYALDGNG